MDVEKKTERLRHVLDGMTVQVWSALRRELVRHAALKARRYAMLLARDGLPFDIAPEEIVAEAIKAAVTGRTWNVERYPEAIDFLKSVLDSRLSHVVRAALTRRDQGWSQAPLEAREDGDDPFDYLPERLGELSQSAVEGECAEEFDRRVTAATGGEEVLQGIAEILRGGLSYAELGEMLGMTKKELYGHHQRFVRRLRKSLGEHPCWSYHSRRTP